ncbi:MAG: DUF2207 domain-containing protein, partial [Paracoccus sp. (in: a-proteobacteria)]|nr:DUF2207 domain-containing protein [Paracoccus sp. (in: a-proteobacteria)]
AVAPPSEAMRHEWFMRDHAAGRDAIILAGLLVAVLAALWYALGRDPAPGLSVPRWDPPRGMSAALIGAIWNRDTSEGVQVLSLDLVELASMGHLSVERSGARITAVALRENPPTRSNLPARQLQILDRITAIGGRLEIGRAQSDLIEDLIKQGRNSLGTEYRRQRNYRNPALVVLVAIALTVFAVAHALRDQSESPAGLAAIFGVFMVIALFLLRLTIIPPRRFKRSAGQIVMGYVFSAIFGVIAVVLGAVYFSVGHDMLLLLAVLVMVAGLVLFGPIMGGPTPEGQRRLDEIRGLVDYIELAEVDRLKYADMPEMSVARFERILPYAMALNLEDVWTKKFRDWLATAGPVAAALTAQTGAVLDDGTFSLARAYHNSADSSSTGQLSDLSSSLTRALPPPSVSSSAFSSGGGSSSGSSGGSSSGAAGRPPATARAPPGHRPAPPGTGADGQCDTADRHHSGSAVSGRRRPSPG